MYRFYLADASYSDVHLVCYRLQRSSLRHQLPLFPAHLGRIYGQYIRYHYVHTRHDICSWLSRYHTRMLMCPSVLSVTLVCCRTLRVSEIFLPDPTGKFSILYPTRSVPPLRDPTRPDPRVYRCPCGACVLSGVDLCMGLLGP